MGSLSEIDQALGLGGDEEMWMPDLDGFAGYGNPFEAKNAYHNEDDDLAAAIAASLQDVQPGGMQQQQLSSQANLHKGDDKHVDEFDFIDL